MASDLSAFSLVHGAFMLDPVTYRVVVDGRRIALTPLEFRLLQYLMAHVGRACTHREILRGVWGYDDPEAANVVAACIWRLRRKIESDPAHPHHIVTARRRGYTFQP
jgi:DNA-binding response OmpR family regulator